MAGLFTVQVQGRQEALYELSNSSEAEIRSSCKKSDLSVLAKRYVKANDSLIELEKALSVFPGCGTPQGRRSQPYAHVPVKNVPLASNPYAIVPHIASVPLSKLDAALKQESDQTHSLFKVPQAFNDFGSSKAGLVYWRFWGLLKVCLIYGPLIVGMVYLFYALIAMWYLIAHPQLLARGMFHIIKSTPSAVGLSFDAVGASIWGEVGDLWVR